MCPKLAIIIPFYKLSFFEDTLKSLAEQTNNNFNVYIGDDNSPDSPVDLIEKYNIHNNFFYKKFEENLGSKGYLVEQWERCISLSNGEEWLMILADDDYVSENFVEVLYKNLETAEKEKINLLRFKIHAVDENSNKLADMEQPSIYEAKDYFWEDEMRKRFISISENVFSRSAYEAKKFRKYPLAWRSDTMIYLDFTNVGKVMGINEAFVAIRQSAQQLTQRRDVMKYKYQAMKLFSFDVLKEYSGYFNPQQNLKFLKSYTYYLCGKNELEHSLSSYYLKWGGMKGLMKYWIKKIFIPSEYKNRLNNSSKSSA